MQAEINSDTVEWICAAYAVYTQYNHKTLGVIGGLSDQEKESSQDRIKLTLSEGWGINGRDDVTEVINRSQGNLFKNGEKIGEERLAGAFHRRGYDKFFRG